MAKELGMPTGVQSGASKEKKVKAKPALKKSAGEIVKQTKEATDKGTFEAIIREVEAALAEIDQDIADLEAVYQEQCVTKAGATA